MAALLAVSANLFADDLPDYDAVNLLSQKAKQTADDFYQNTFKMRMRYEYSGRFTDPNDKTKLLELATMASADLEQIADDQNNLKKQIEDYQGDDWETKFGQTGLWRRLTADLQKTKSAVAQIDSYSDIAGDASPGCPPSTVHAGCDDIKSAMEQIKCRGLSEPGQLDTLAGLLVKSDCRDNPEMLLLLAILQLKYDPDILQKNASVQPFFPAWRLGELILQDMWPRLQNTPVTDVNFESFSPADVELAATSVLLTNPLIRFHLDFIAKLAESERFQTPAVVYTAALTHKASNPRKAVVFFIKASTLQLKKNNVFLGKTAEEIAAQAFDFAYREFTGFNGDFQPVIEAYENYLRIAPDKIDEQTKFHYADLLNRYNRTDGAVEIFRRLADGPQSLWRDAAALELLKIRIRDSAKPGEPNAALSQLRDFILQCTSLQEQQLQLRFAAMDLYCTTLLHWDGNDSAEKILYILDNAQPTPDFEYDFFRAAAFKQMGRLQEAAHTMTRALNQIDSSKADRLFSLLSEILDKIELLEHQVDDFNQMLLDCNTLAEFASNIRKSPKNVLPFAEVSILRADLDRAAFLLSTAADENDIRWLRPEARLLMAQGNFAEAARLWAKIADLHRNETAETNRKSYGWWQAKFYEFDCLTKLPSANLKDIHHAIEVLQSTYAEIPAPFAEKLESLKQRCVTN